MVTRPSSCVARWLLSLLVGWGLFIATSLAETTPQGLADWAGVYRFSGVDLYYIHANGDFEWAGSEFSSGSDAGHPASGSGKAVYDQGRLILRFDRLSEHSQRKVRIDQPYIFTAITAGRWHLLLDDDTLIGAANQANGSGRQEIEGYHFLHRVADFDGKRDPATGKVLSLSDLHGAGLLPNVESYSRDPAVRSTQLVQLRQYLPAPDAERFLARPLSGKITRIGPITVRQVDVSHGRMPVFEWRSRASITIDRGSQQGVFVGMRLYARHQRVNAVVERVGKHSSEAALEWTGERPLVGSFVSSSYR